jgi:predicted aldo/keto reductase-like oxidoreductase
LEKRDKDGNIPPYPWTRWDIENYTGIEIWNHMSEWVEGLTEKTAAEIYKEYENKGESINDLCTGCGYCDECPVGVQIPKYMDAYNMTLLGDSFQNRLDWHWDVVAAGAGECIRCGKCEGLCTQHLPIMERLAYIAENGKK